MTYTDRKGDWMITYTGKRFYPLDPRAEDIDIVDIAHALSLTNRFNGHTEFPYSVAQHSLKVSLFVTDGQFLGGLLHDAAEAYVNDMVRPVKQYLVEYKAIENGILNVIEQKYNVNTRTPQIKLADNSALVTEASQLCSGESWYYDSHWPTPFPYTIHPRNWESVQEEFLERFEQIATFS